MRVLFFHRGITSFIEKDLALFRKLGSVLQFDADRMGLRDYKRAIRAVREEETSILYCWFAGRHALFAAILSKIWRKVFVIVGGGMGCCEGTRNKLWPHAGRVEEISGTVDFKMRGPSACHLTIKQSRNP